MAANSDQPWRPKDAQEAQRCCGLAAGWVPLEALETGRATGRAGPSSRVLTGQLRGARLDRCTPPALPAGPRVTREVGACATVSSRPLTGPGAALPSACQLLTPPLAFFFSSFLKNSCMGIGFMYHVPHPFETRVIWWFRWTCRWPTTLVTPGRHPVPCPCHTSVSHPAQAPARLPPVWGPVLGVLCEGLLSLSIVHLRSTCIVAGVRAELTLPCADAVLPAFHLP